MTKVFIAGASGLLGRAVGRYCRAKGMAVLGASRGRYPLDRHIVVDILQPETYLAELKKFGPDVLLNCAALVDLARCEKETEYARAQNGLTAQIMAGLSKELGAKFIHYSTDHLYDGQNAPYAEGDPVCPINWYGKTKLLGENLALENNSETLVVRTNIVGVLNEPGRQTFAEWLNTSLKQGSAITLFTDYITSSAHVDEVARLSFLALEKGASGVLNIAARNAASKYDFGMLFAKKMGYDTSNVTMGKMAEKGLCPPRPANSALNCGKVEQLLGVRLPTIEDTVEMLKRDFAY